MKYRLVQSIEGQLVATDFTPDNVIPAMSVRGHEMTGRNSNPRHRAELQGQPKFSGVCGPMWGGIEDGVPCIRYESIEAYRQLST